MKIKKRLAKSISYGVKRPLEDVKYIVIHYTGNKGDTAKNNVDYFATGNNRAAGAHFFVDKQGDIYKSINMTRIAYSVGGDYRSGAKGEAAYYGKCVNANSVSIELCDCLEHTNWEQMKAVRQLVIYIQQQCPNAKTIIRHWDVNGKACPAPMTGINNEKWNRLYTFITKGYQYKAKVAKPAAVRSSAKAASQITGTINTGKVVKITKISENEKWGRLKKKNPKGEYRWIKLSKVKKI